MAATTTTIFCRFCFIGLFGGLVTHAFGAAQEDGKWAISTRETGPSLRSLHGVWWNSNWEAKKVLYARFPDGTRKACSCGFGVLVFW